MSQSNSLTHSSKTPSVKVNMPREKAWPYLRHRPPMAWISEVLHFGSEDDLFSGRCRVDINSDSLFLDEKGVIYGAAAIEMCAQGYGFARAAYQIHNGIDYSPQRTYLAGVSHCQTFFNGWDPVKDPSLFVDIKTDRVAPPLIIVSGEVSGAFSETLLAQLQLTLYIS